ncbi:ATP-binding protein [Methanosarcina sp. T3]|uniref:ATP-binding protein n=1 Tax=Methanosarcina sp. T3 TaxID=3439062 RepID=UPI003F833205
MDNPSEAPDGTVSHFKTNVLLKSILGKDLINDDNIAVIELVKNSIDAGSPVINVEFRNLKNCIVDDFGFFDSGSEIGSEIGLSEAPKLIITDFGIGMDAKDIETKWLNIAYSEKKNSKGEDGRLYAGAKGVGRFSCDRLGEYLDLYSRKKDKKIRHLHIKWSDFEVDNEGDLEIQDVGILHHDISDEEFYDHTGLGSFDQGTIVEISKLRSYWAHYHPRKDEWDLSKILKLKKYLEKLVNPHYNISGKGIKIYLVAKEFVDQEKKSPTHEKVNGLIENKIFERLEFKTTSIESFISPDGKETTTILRDKGRIIFCLREKNVKFPLLKNIRIVLFFLNQYSKIFFTKQVGVRPVEFGSIHLFINGFRVPPFGDEGNDWLGLEIRKGQGYARFLGTRDLIGWVEITDESNDFQIISSREGLVKNQKYLQLTDGSNSYFYDVFRKIEKYVVEGLDWDRISKKSPGEEIDDDFSELRNPEVKKYIKMAEDKVLKKGLELGEDEIYGETQGEKDLRVIQLIYSILSTKPDHILELYINEDLIRLLAVENKEKVQNIFKDFSKIKPHLLNSSTSKVINDVNLLFENQEKELHEKSQRLREELEEKKKIENELKNARIEAFRAKEQARKEEIERKRAQRQADIEKKEKEKAVLRAEQEIDKREIAEKEANEAKFQIKTLSSQNYFLKNSKEQSKDQLISYLHIIGTKSLTLESHIRSILSILEQKEPDIQKAVEKIYKLNRVNNQIYTISNVGSKGGINENEFKKKENDIIGFIHEYLINISIPYTEGIKVHPFEKPNFNLVKEFEPFSISYVIDSFIDNALKANSNNIYFSASIINGSFKLDIEDDGDGIPQEVIDIQSIFEPGVRYSKKRGSGLGLYDVKSFLEKIGGSVVVYRSKPKGVKFEVVIKK